MTIGKEIKVVLTLDDAGFSVKTKNAAEAVKGFESGLGTFTKSMTSLEGAISGLSSNIGGFVSSFSQLQKSFAATMQKLETSALSGFGAIDRAQRQSADVARQTGKEFSDARIRALQSEIETDNKIIAQRGKMHAELRKLESDTNAKAMARSMLLDTPGTGAVRDPLNRNRFTSRAVIQEEVDALRQLATAQGIAAIQAGEAARASINSRTARLQGIDAIRQEAAAEREAAAAKKISDAEKKASGQTAAQAARESANAQKQANREAAQSAKEAAAIKKQAADQEARDRRAADAEIVRSANAAAAEQRLAARQVAEEHSRQTQQIAQMWKNMAMIYAGAKIEHGLAKSVGLADQMERQMVGVSTLSLPWKEQTQMIASTEAMANNLKFISTLDTVKSRMSAIASIGYNNAEIIDKTLTSAVKAANNLQYLGQTHDDAQTLIRNMYGVVEMRQQTKDANATKQTFETLQKIITGTAGKVQTQDIETLLRRMGMGASQLSDKGLINLAAVVDQFKVAGGNQGGSGGGVSTVGTAFKMMQAYALGKGLSNTAVQEFSGAGVLGASGIDLTKDDAGVLRDAKHGGFKNADLWLKDPVAAVQSIMPQIIAYTQSAKQKSKFYQGRDINDSENQMVAVSMYLARLGITTTASQALMVAGDPRSQERIAHQAKTISGSKGINEVSAEMEKTVGMDFTIVKAQLTDIGILVGTQLLPPLKAFLGVVKEILFTMKSVAKDNPLATQITGITAAVTGAIISVKGFTRLMGAAGFGSTLTAILGIAPAAAGAGGALAAAGVVGGGGWMGFKLLFAEIGVAFGGLIMRIPGMTSLVAIFSGSIGALGGTTGIVSRVFAGLLGIFNVLAKLLLSFDIGWLIGTWVSSITVGTATIGEHFQNMFLFAEVGWRKMLINLKEFWFKFKQEVGYDNSTEFAANMKGSLAEREKLVNFERERRIVRHEAQTDEQVLRRQTNDHDVRPTAEVEAEYTADAISRRNELAKADKAVRESASRDNAVKARLGAGLAGSGGNAHGRPDPLKAALEESRGKLSVSTIELEAQISGIKSLATIYAEVEADIKGKLAGGKFSNDPKKKPPELKSPQVQELIKNEARGRLNEEETKAIVFANERVAATEVELGDAMERVTSSNVEKQTDAFRALAREMARAEKRMVAGTQGFREWGREKAQALYNRASADSFNLVADYSDQDSKSATALLDTQRERLEAELAEVRRVEQAKYDIRMSTRAKEHEALLLSTESTIGNERQREETIARMKEDFANKTALLESGRAAHVEQLALTQTRALERPIETLAREWKDSSKDMADNTAKWATESLDAITKFVTTGKLDFKSFAESILSDILKMQMKQAMGGSITDLVGRAGSWVGGMLGVGGAGVPMNGAGSNAAGTATGSDGPAGDFGLLSVAATSAATSLTKTALQGDGLTGSLASSITQTAIGATAEATKDAALATSTNMLWSFTAALQSASAMLGLGGGSGVGGLAGMVSGLFGGGESATAAGIGDAGAIDGFMSGLGFANGGIMTNFGPVELRKYAAGGIANSPQLALYGEAGPEAYVPLPDGRSIPVTMNGSQGAPSVTVNVINQSGQQVSAQQGQQRFDGKQLILDVVLSAVSSPGGFRDGMKGALR